jgi:hypothetical protein
MPAASARACASSRALLQFSGRALRVLDRFLDRGLAVIERLQERLPGEPVQQEHQHQEGDDGPDEQSRIHGDEIVHGTIPFTGRTRRRSGGASPLTA